jgi:hypothetical protein
MKASFCAAIVQLAPARMDIDLQDITINPRLNPNGNPQIHKAF